MSEAIKTTITIKPGFKDPWNKPDSNQYWYSVIVEEYGEPIKFIQDRDKGAPEPIVGKQFKGNLYQGPKGYKFYPFVDKPKQSSSPVSADTQYLKDTSDLPRSLVIELLKYYDVQSLYNSPQYSKMIALAQSLNDDITAMIKANRGDTAPKVEEKPTTIQEKNADWVPGDDEIH